MTTDYMQIPFAPPYIDDEVKKEVMDSLESGWITTGPKAKALEKKVALFCGAEAALGVSSATAGMQLMLHWLGIQPGDEVIVPAYTYCATALAAIHAGATVVMVDVKPDFTLDAAAVDRAITPRTKAIIAVDFGGWPADYDALYSVVNKPSIKKKYKAGSTVQQLLGRILLISDAAHAFGAVYHNRRAGTLADATVFSFHAVKNITTAEGGMICFSLPRPFDNSEMYNTLRIWSLNGQTKDALSKSQQGGWKYDVIHFGYKMNLPDVLAAIGLAQYKNYESHVLAGRRRVYATYNNAFKQHSWALCPPFERSGCESAYHLYPLRIRNIGEEQRDDIIDHISKQGVAVNVHFIPLPLLTAFKTAGYQMADYPQSYALYASEISLPVYPQLTPRQCQYVIETVIQAVTLVLYA